MQRHARHWLLFSCLVVLALAPMAASAYSYVMMEDADLFDSAEGVVTARIERVLPAADGDAETRYEVRILNVLAGPKLAARETLVLPGTFNAPNLNMVVEGVPQLAPGATVMLFHARRADGVLQPKQLSLGVFGRVETAQGNYYVRHLEGAREFGKRDIRQRFHAARAAASFEHWLTDRARGVRRAPDYLREDVEVDADAAKFTFAMFNFNPPGPARWFQFDTDVPLVWLAGAGGQANTASDEFSALQLALASWTNDPNSRILTTYGGTVPDVPVPGVCGKPQQGTIGFAGRVCWNDPAGLIDGSFNCMQGGTLAIGGSFASSGGQMFGGQVWYPRSNAFVVVQDNAGCSMDGNGGANGAELLVHEVGHALAFGHACGDSATPACNSDAVLNDAAMRAFLHGDGRGAALGADDRAAAALAYPAAGGGDMTAPTVPSNLAAGANGSASVNVSWNAANDSGGSGLAGYELERCAGAACNNFVEVAEQVSTNVADGGLTSWTTFRYRVRAFDGAGNRSGYSSIATATTAPTPAQALSDGVPVPNLAGAQASEALFTLQVPAGATNLVFQSSGGSGDADLFVRFGAMPTPAIFDCDSQGPTNTEACSIPAPQAGTYHVKLVAFNNFTGVSLIGDFEPPSEGCTGDCIFRGGFE